MTDFDDHHQGWRHDQDPGDLAVGDQVALRQERATDGTYTVTGIVVVLPTVAGQVSAIDGDTIKVTQPGGTSDDPCRRQHHLSVGGANGSLSGLKVGIVIVAEGTQRADGSLDAAAIRSGLRPDIRGRGGPGTVKPSPAPSSQGG